MDHGGFGGIDEKRSGGLRRKKTGRSGVEIEDRRCFWWVMEMDVSRKGTLGWWYERSKCCCWGGGNTYGEDAVRICKISEEIPNLTSRDGFCTVNLLVNCSKADWQACSCRIILKICYRQITYNNATTQEGRGREMASISVVNQWPNLINHYSVELCRKMGP